MAMDLSAPGSHIIEGTGDGLTSGTPLRQTVQVDNSDISTGPLQVALPGSAAVTGAGSIATGGAAQHLFGGAAPTNGYLVQNTSNAPLYIDDARTASASDGLSLLLVEGGGYWETPTGYKPPGAVSIIGGTTGQTFYARSW